LRKDNFLHLGWTRDKSGWTHEPPKDWVYGGKKTFLKPRPRPLAPPPASKSSDSDTEEVKLDSDDDIFDPNSTLVTELTPSKRLKKGLKTGKMLLDGKEISSDLQENVALYGHFRVPTDFDIEEKTILAVELRLKKYAAAKMEAQYNAEQEAASIAKEIMAYEDAIQEQANEDFALCIVRETISDTIKSFIPTGSTAYQTVQYLESNYKPSVIDTTVREYRAFVMYAYVDRPTGKQTLLEMVQLFEKKAGDLKLVNPLVLPEVVLNFSFVLWMETLIQQLYGTMQNELQVTMTTVKASDDLHTKTFKEIMAPFRQLKCSGQLVVAKSTTSKPSVSGSSSKTSSTGSSNSRYDSGSTPTNFWCNTCKWNRTHPTDYCLRPLVTEHYRKERDTRRIEANKAFKPTQKDKETSAATKKKYSDKTGSSDKSSLAGTKQKERSDDKTDEKAHGGKKYKHNFNMMHTGPSSEKMVIYYDNCCSFHLTGNLDILQDIVELKVQMTTVTGNGPVHATHIGRVEFRNSIGEELVEFRNVYYVPESEWLQKYLIISQGLTESKGRMITLSGFGTFGVYSEDDTDHANPILVGTRGEDLCMRLNYTEIIGLKEVPVNPEASKLFALTRLQSRRQEKSQDDAELEGNIGIQLQMETNYFFLLDNSMEVNPVTEIVKEAPKRSLEAIATSRPKVNKRRKADTTKKAVIEEIFEDNEVKEPKIVEIISPPIGQPTEIREPKPVEVVTGQTSGSLSEDRGNPDIKL